MNVDDMNNSNAPPMSKLEQLARKRAQQRQQQQQNINQVNNSTAIKKKLSLKDKLAALKEKKLETTQQSITKGSTLLQSLKDKKILTNTIGKTDKINDSTIIIEQQASQPKNESSSSIRLHKSTVNNILTTTDKNDKFSRITGLKTSHSSLSSKLDHIRKRKQEGKLEKNISSLSNNQIALTDQTNNDENNNYGNNNNDSISGNSQFNLLININWSKFDKLTKKYSISADSDLSSTTNKGQFINFIQQKNDVANKNYITMTQAVKRKYIDIFSIFEPLDYVKRQKYRQNFMELSPDDIILEMQSKAFDNMNKKISKLNISKKNNIDDNDTELQLPIKSRTMLDIHQYLLARPNNLRISILGHHLSGKSTLMGRLLMDFKKVDIETIRKLKNLCNRNKIENKHTYLTWLSDDLSIERSVGHSEILHKHDICIKGYGKFTFFVNPSKQNVNSELITQMFNNDIVIMVIDCSPDGFEKGFNLNGQTIEFSILAKLCGCKHIIVVLNKMDTVDWYQGRYDEIVNELTTFYDTIGFHQEDISWIPISSVTGDGIVNKNTLSDWYQGLPLVEILKKKIKEFSKEDHKSQQFKHNKVLDIGNTNVSVGEQRSPEDEFCSLSIKDIDVYKNEITGWIINGCIQAGESIRIYPLSKNFLVDEIKNDIDDKQIGVPSSFVTMKLLSSTSRNEKGLLDNIEIGDFVTSLLSPVALMNSITIKLEIIAILTNLTIGMKLIINRQMYTNTVKILKMNKMNSKSIIVIECELSRQDTIPYFESVNERENFIIIRVSGTNKIIGLAKLIK